MKDSATNKQRIPESQRRVVMEGKSERVSNIWKNPVPNRGEVQISSQQPIIQGKTPILVHKTKESLMKENPKETHWTMAGKEVCL